MKLPPVVSDAEWQAALDDVRKKEKRLTREHDALAAERRRLPRVRIDKEYVFEGRTVRRASSTCSRAGAS
jgi:predicted dithiol-disulfide oxidoreductase (DUF899 family)